MKTRSYHQYCPIAHALDVVGDRWTLLIVRDLLVGPKRFSDLLRGLPGIGTNILTDRLKGLEQTQVIRQRVLPPPAASTVYELTPSGAALRGVIGALAEWGRPTLASRQADQLVPPDALMLPVQGWFTNLFGRSASAATSGYAAAPQYVVRCPDLSGDVVLAVQIASGSVTVQLDRFDPQTSKLLEPSTATGDQAYVTVTADAQTLYALAAGDFSLDDAISTGRIQLAGEPEQQARLLEAARRAALERSTRRSVRP